MASSHMSAIMGKQTPGNTISVIDLPVQEELLRLDLGALQRPHGMLFVDGKVLFTAEMNRLIARYDPVADQVDWLFGTGQETTHMLVVNADASLIFTANIGSNNVSAIESVASTDGWNETVIPVGKGPEGIDWSPDGKEVWTATGGDGDELVVLDRATRKERARLKLGHYPEGILIRPDSSRAYVAQEGANDTAVIDLKTLTVAGHISPGNGPDGMAWAERK
jgi:YVTN family beta-propeller protein